MCNHNAYRSVVIFRGNCLSTALFSKVQTQTHKLTEKETDRESEIETDRGIKTQSVRQ